jgi:hypothetical protein
MKQLTCYAHPAPDKPQHCPFLPNPITYDMAKILRHLLLPMTVLSLMRPVRNTSNKLLVVSCSMQGPSIQQYSWHYPTLPLNKLLSLRTPGSESNFFLDYMWTHPDSKIRYHASNMILNIHSNASYLSAPCPRSRAGGYFFLGSLPLNGNPIKLNGTIHITCTILKLVAPSAVEAELGTLFLNAQEAKVLRLTLNKLGHPQPPTTPIHIDNTTTAGIVNNTIMLPCNGDVILLALGWENTVIFQVLLSAQSRESG